MKVQRYVAANSRDALARARAELGPDAVVLSGRQTEAGFELLALAKGDIAVLVNAGREAPARPAPPAAPAGAGQPRKKAAPVKGHGAAAAAVGEVAPGIRPWIPPKSISSGTYAPAPAAAPSPVPAPSPAAAPPAASTVGTTVPAARGTEPMLVNEIRALRNMVEEQGAHLAWMNAGDRAGNSHPLRSAMLHELMQADFSPALSRRIAEALPRDLTPEAARQWVAAALVRNLRCAGPAPAGTPDLVAEGGVYALVGPTGAGKTTTVAKLAAGCVVRHGADSLGLVSADHYRIGAHDQLRIYARILGVAVHAVHDAESLGTALAALSGKRLVLIDSTGVGQRDPRVAEQSALFAGAGVNQVLLLSAASQAQTLDEVAQAYGAHSPAGAILTKTDEAAALGGVLDCAIRHRLRISHVTNGQRVPEDIHLANGPYLVHRALSASRAPVFRMEENELDLLAFMPPRGATPRTAHAGR